MFIDPEKMLLRYVSITSFVFLANFTSLETLLRCPESKIRLAFCCPSHIQSPSNSIHCDSHNHGSLLFLDYHLRIGKRSSTCRIRLWKFFLVHVCDHHNPWLWRLYCYNNSWSIRDRFYCRDWYLS